MATVENKPPVIQVTAPGEVTLVLTQEEAEGLRSLFGPGLSVGAINALKLNDLSDAIRSIEWLECADVSYENAPLCVHYVSPYN